MAEISTAKYLQKHLIPKEMNKSGLNNPTNYKINIHFDFGVHCPFKISGSTSFFKTKYSCPPIYSLSKPKTAHFFPGF